MNTRESPSQKLLGSLVSKIGVIIMHCINNNKMIQGYAFVIN